MEGFGADLTLPSTFCSCWSTVNFNGNSTTIIFFLCLRIICCLSIWGQEFFCPYNIFVFQAITFLCLRKWGQYPFIYFTKCYSWVFSKWRSLKYLDQIIIVHATWMHLFLSCRTCKKDYYLGKYLYVPQVHIPLLELRLCWKRML